ncbi:hypothetical protein [Olivibacter jilunii]|uniref:hypothetical protein n=1 Tax=Olivibacter jilunii TaxID=985016 RepID=UPI003F15155D
MGNLLLERIAAYFEQKKLVEYQRKELETSKVKLIDAKKKVKDEYRKANIVSIGKTDKYITELEKIEALNERIPTAVQELDKRLARVAEIYKALEIEHISAYYKNKKHKITYDRKTNTLIEEVL